MNNDAPLDTPDYIKTHYRAVLCTDRHVSAKTNTGTGSGGEKIYWPNGDKVADNYNDFYDGNWDAAYYGGQGQTVWTGCIDNGEVHPTFHPVGNSGNNVTTTSLIGTGSISEPDEIR